MFTFSLSPRYLLSYRNVEGSQKPIYERVGDVQRQKRENLHKLQQQVDDERKPTFKPYVNPISRKMASDKLTHSDGEEEGETQEGAAMSQSMNISTLSLLLQFFLI